MDENKKSIYCIDDENYINKCKAYISLMLSSQQWSGITKADVNRWLSNFEDVTEQELCVAYKILSKLIYFSERDVENLLRDTITNKLFSDLILQKQIENEFQLSEKALNNIVQEEICGSCFVPLLDSDAPHESGNYVSRLLVQKEIIRAEQSFFLNKLAERYYKNHYKRIIIVDDCIGSGQQISTFWDETAKINVDGQLCLLKEWINENHIEVIYLALFGYEENVKRLQKDKKGIKIYCAKMLGDMHRVFNKESYMWDSAEEYEMGYDFLSRIVRENGIELLGYTGLDFAFIMHQTIPDWSLPIFWRETSDWKCLLRRKNSNV